MFSKDVGNTYKIIKKHMCLFKNPHTSSSSFQLFIHGPCSREFTNKHQLWTGNKHEKTKKTLESPWGTRILPILYRFNYFVSQVVESVFFDIMIFSFHFWQSVKMTRNKTRFSEGQLPYLFNQVGWSKNRYNHAWTVPIS